MANTWFISDTHFGHANILGFKTNEGLPCREFSCVEEMDETMVERWNSVVRQHDRIYHLGDVAINRKSISTLSRCNGKKVLIKGNHDIFPLKDYIEHFEDIRAYKVFPQDGIICSHIPVYSGQLEGRFKLNVHGHLHNNVINDLRYRNICVEHTNYTPISLEQIRGT